MSQYKNIVCARFVLAMFLVVGGIVFWRGSASAQELVQDQKSTSTAESKDKAEVYSYVAQPGDSYSLIARKAVQTYGLINKVKLSEAQIIFAETNITQSAGSPRLMQGEKVDIKVDTISTWAKKAEALNEKQQAAWNVYAKRANFNTDKVGQPAK